MLNMLKIHVKHGINYLNTTRNFYWKRKGNNMKPLMDLKNCSLTHLWDRVRVRFATHVDIPTTKVKLAFTLAEVLITLGIIGIVAAMTIPNLITTHQKKVTVTRLEKSISVLNQAYKLSIAEQGQPEVNDILNMDIEDYFYKYWAPYLKHATYCETPMDCGYKSRFFKQQNGNTDNYQMTKEANFTFLTNDGMVYSIQIRGYCSNCLYVNGYIGTNGELTIIVDINGSKNPNVFGKDVFFLGGSNFDDIGIQPFGYDKTNDEINEDCSKDGTGRYCAEKIKRAGWQIDKSYPW